MKRDVFAVSILFLIVILVMVVGVYEGKQKPPSNNNVVFIKIRNINVINNTKTIDPENVTITLIEKYKNLTTNLHNG